MLGSPYNLTEVYKSPEGVRAYLFLDYSKKELLALKRAEESLSSFDSSREVLDILSSLKERIKRLETEVKRYSEKLEPFKK